jgi:excisionase family DNA binding protein
MLLPHRLQNTRFMSDSLISRLDQRETVSLMEAARILGISDDTLRRYARDGDIPGGFQTRKGKRWRFRRKELEAWWQKVGRD